VLRSAELKRRGIAVVEGALRAGPVYLLKRNRPAAVVLSADDYQDLQRSEAQPVTAGPSCLEWLLDLPRAAAGKSRGAIDAELNAQRDW
jgi:prevent-host-death family protein